MGASLRWSKEVWKAPLFVIVFIAIFLSVGIPGVAGVNQQQKRNKLDRVWRKSRRQCIANDCSHIHTDENDNCVNACTSDACFEEVYGSEPLEPGEVDFARWRTFTRCARKEVGKEHKRQREESYKSRYANHGKTKEGGN